MPVVRIEYTTAIPSPVVFYGGTSFNGGVKSTITLEINLDLSGEPSLNVLNRTWGETRQYTVDDTIAVSGKPDWWRNLRPSAQPTGRDRLPMNDSNLRAEWRVPNGATHGVFLFVDGGNPLLPDIAPNINGEITIGLRKNGTGIECLIEGAHDGFPSHGVKVGGLQALSYDCVTANETPLALFPPMDKAINATGWQRLP